MAEKLKFKVLRRHDGDRVYEEGEIREGTQAELGHLTPNVLELIGEADPVPASKDAKAEPAPMNKAEPAPENKSETAATITTNHPRPKRK